ncbi:hypothetical protein, partial [Cetobacterium sp.]
GGIFLLSIIVGIISMNTPKAKAKKEQAKIIKLEQEEAKIKLEEERKREEELAKAELLKQEEAKKIEKERIPAMSAWNGVAYAISDYLKKNANDPKSIEYIDVYKMQELDNGLFAQQVKFRAKNGFGGMIIEEYIFVILGSSNSSRVVSVGSREEFNQMLKKEGIKAIKYHDAY